jgi:hypothetical protein
MRMTISSKYQRERGLHQYRVVKAVVGRSAPCGGIDDADGRPID